MTNKQTLRDIAEQTKIAGEAPVMPFEQRINALNEFMKHFTPATMLALLDELETKEEQRANWFQMAQKLGEDLDAAEKRIAELEALAKSVKFDPIPMNELGNKGDGKKHPYMFGAGYNSAVVHCESVLLQVFAAAGIGKGE